MTIKQFAYDFQGFEKSNSYYIKAKPHTFKWKKHEVKLTCEWELDCGCWYPQVDVYLDGQKVADPYDISYGIGPVNGVWVPNDEEQQWSDFQMEEFDLTFIGRKKLSKEFLAMLEQLLIKHLESLKEAA